MSFSPSDSRIKVPQGSTLEEQIASAPDAATIQMLLKDAAKNQGLVRPDLFDENILHETPLGTPHAYGKTVVINGKKYIIEGTSEHELTVAETNLYRQLFNPEAAAEQPRDAAGRFVEVPAERSDADRVAADVVEKSLREQGIDPEALRDYTNQRLMASWGSAVDEFKATVGSWWIGGEENTKKMSETLLAMGATDYPNVENLQKAAEYLRDNNLLVENPEAQLHDAIGEANDPYTLRQLLQNGR